MLLWNDGFFPRRDEAPRAVRALKAAVIFKSVSWVCAAARPVLAIFHPETRSDHLVFQRGRHAPWRGLDTPTTVVFFIALEESPRCLAAGLAHLVLAGRWSCLAGRWSLVLLVAGLLYW